MKTTLIALLALGMCLPLVGADKKKTGVEKAGYKGRVKSVKEAWFDIEEKFGKPVRTSVDRSTNAAWYDEKGNKVAAKYHEYSEGSETFKYDVKGNLVEVVAYDASGKITGGSSRKYDEKGNLVEVVQQGSQLLTDGHAKSTYKYAEKGNLVERVNCDASGKITGKYTFKCDEKGNKVAETRYMLKTVFGKTRFIPYVETVWEFTYWD